MMLQAEMHITKMGQIVYLLSLPSSFISLRRPRALNKVLLATWPLTVYTELIELCIYVGKIAEWRVETGQGKLLSWKKGNHGFKISSLP